MKATEKMNILPFIHNVKQNVNTQKLSRSLSFKAHNLKTMQSSCNLKTDLDRAKAEHSYDVIC